jgi:hypothetical protein
MQLVDTPVPGVSELRSLKALLGHARITTSDDLRQDQHYLSTLKGDVDAKTTKSSLRSSAGPISSTSNHTSVVNATVANPAAHDSVAGTIAARTPRKTTRLRHRKGGVR